LAYLLIGVVLLATIGAIVLSAVRLRHAVHIERQTLRTQQLAQTTLELRNLTLEAEATHGVSAALAARRNARLVEADATFDSIRRHNPSEAARLEKPYRAYVALSNRAFEGARLHAGIVPDALEQGVQARLTRLQTAIGHEATDEAAASQRANPAARSALITALVFAGVLVLLLTWQFEHERRAGRIDRDSAARAEELARLRDEFVAVVSHELRTPLTSIMGYLELLMDEGTASLNADQKSYLAVVHRSAARLGELVGDLLLVAEAERTALSLELGDVDTATLVAHTVEAARPAADAREIQLVAETGAPGGLLHGDPTRLGQMLDNLVSNAIKFTPAGGRVVVRGAAGDTHALFEVSDTGGGIAAADRARLFEPFYRSRDATARAVPGTGLGLTIAKAIVDAHRGTIEVESETHAGTTFRVRIPLRQRAAVAVYADAPAT
jgi:signal transduction histidine kinase